jgi:hypothetical protein
MNVHSQRESASRHRIIACHQTFFHLSGTNTEGFHGKNTESFLEITCK